MYNDLILLNPPLLSVIMLLSGLVLTFHGHRVVPFALVLLSIAAAMVYTGSFLQLFTDNPSVLRVAPFVVSFLVALLVLLIYRSIFFVAGALISYFSLSSLFPEMSPLYLLLFALVSGAIAFRARVFVFSLLTAFMGSGLVAGGLVTAFAVFGFQLSVVAYWGVVVVFFLTGFLTQIKRKR